MMHPPEESGVVVLRYPDGCQAAHDLGKQLARQIKEHLRRREPLVITMPKSAELEGWEIEFHSRNGTSWPYQVIRLSELERK